MTILVGLFSILFTRVLGRWRGALIAILGISLYTLLVGAQASVVRAAIMPGFFDVPVRSEHPEELFWS
jgi:predicted membrane metal-binding protein